MHKAVAPGTRFPTADGHDSDSAVPDEEQTAAKRGEKRAERVADFVSVFGSVAGQPEGEFSVSLPQALFLANSETVSAWLPPRMGNLADRLVTLGSSHQVADELFLSVLSRWPSDDERRLVAEHLDNAGHDRRRAVSELVWSQLASAEFRLNH